MTKIAGRVGELRGHRGPVALQDGLLVPGALAEELLQGLVGVGDVQARRQGDAGGHRLDALAVAVGGSGRGGRRRTRRPGGAG